jgi:hypothetical protein
MTGYDKRPNAKRRSTVSGTSFKRLIIDGWRQFDKVEIDLHPNLTILTGANGAGKSTLVNIFTRHFGWERPYIGTPLADETTGILKYFAGLLKRLGGKPPQTTSHRMRIGSVTYSNGSEATLYVPTEAQSYCVDVEGQQGVQGLHITSHRALSNYQPVHQFQATPPSPETAYNQYVDESRTRYQGRHSGNSPVFRLKEALIAMAMFGEGNSIVKPNPTVLAIYQGFISTLKKLLPDELGFETIEIRMPEVVIVTKSGSWPIDSASGGILSIIDMAWPIYLFSKQQSEFVVTIDEPENHLHPSMRRSLLANLIATFPKVQFIVATHSPFIITSTPQSYVYVLKFDALEPNVEINMGEQPVSYERRVRSVYLDKASKASSANEILREVLGVPATIPIWVEAKLAEIIKRYRGRAFNDQLLVEFRQELAQLGFSEHYPEAVAALVTKP